MTTDETNTALEQRLYRVSLVEGAPEEITAHQWSRHVDTVFFWEGQLDRSDIVAAFEVKHVVSIIRESPCSGAA